LFHFQVAAEIKHARFLCGVFKFSSAGQLGTTHHFDKNEFFKVTFDPNSTKQSANHA